MAGTVLRILSRTDYDFSQLGQGLSIPTLWVAQNIDVSRFREAALLIRVHARTFTQAAASIQVAVRAVDPSDEDPAQYFRGSAALGTPTTINSATLVPSLQVQVVPANFGRMLSAYLIATQSGAGTGTIAATLSIDLSLKE